MPNIPNSARYGRVIRREPSVNRTDLERLVTKIEFSAISAIDSRAKQLGRTPIAELEHVKGGLRRRYDAGTTIYARLGGPAVAVYGAIASRYDALGGVDGWLGFPVTEEAAFPVGQAGRVTEFAHGRIYWWPTGGALAIRQRVTGVDTVADGRRVTLDDGSAYLWSPRTPFSHVYGEIGKQYGALGGPTGRLGFPTTDELPFDGGGRVNSFEHGELYFWGDVGVIELDNVVVRYAGLICFGEEDNDQLSDADEPYVIMEVTAPFHPPQTTKTKVYTDVDGGDRRIDVIDLYVGKPNGLVLTTVLMEQDDGNPDQYRQYISEAVSTASGGLVAGLAVVPVAGPALAAVAAPLLAAVQPAITDAINDGLDLEDDFLGAESRHLTAKEMIVLAARGKEENSYGVISKFQSRLFARYGASYKVCFWIGAA